MDATVRSLCTGKRLASTAIRAAVNVLAMVPLPVAVARARLFSVQPSYCA